MELREKTEGDVPNPVSSVVPIAPRDTPACACSGPEHSLACEGPVTLWREACCS